jgi:hypothetical protein
MGVVWKGSGDSLAVEGGPVMRKVRIFVEKASRCLSSLSLIVFISTKTC